MWGAGLVLHVLKKKIKKKLMDWVVYGAAQMSVGQSMGHPKLKLIQAVAITIVSWVERITKPACHSLLTNSYPIQI